MLQKLKQINFMFYIALIFLIFPIVGVLSGEYSPILLLWTLFFVLAYFYILIEENPVGQWLAWFVMLIYIAYTIFSVNINFIWYTFYLSNLMTYRLKEASFFSLRYLSFWLFQIFILAKIYLGKTTDLSGFFYIFLILLFMDLLTFGFKREQSIAALKAEQVKQNEQINLLLAESERNRIGRDLHDSLGHTFAMLSLKTELAQQFLQMNELECLGKELQEVHDISKQSMADVRRIIDNLKTRTLPEELATIEKMLEMTGVEVELTNELNIASLPQHLQASMSMILLETATNIIKHAKADHCSIRLHEELGQILLDVEDDGQGFKEVTGQELRSIRERLEALSGEIEILSSSQPTLIRVILPYGGGKS